MKTKEAAAQKAFDERDTLKRDLKELKASVKRANKNRETSVRTNQNAGNTDYPGPMGGQSDADVGQCKVDNDDDDDIDSVDGVYVDDIYGINSVNDGESMSNDGDASVYDSSSRNRVASGCNTVAPDDKPSDTAIEALHEPSDTAIGDMRENLDSVSCGVDASNLRLLRENRRLRNSERTLLAQRNLHRRCAAYEREKARRLRVDCSVERIRRRSLSRSLSMSLCDLSCSGYSTRASGATSPMNSVSEFGSEIGYLNSEDDNDDEAIDDR